MLMQTNKFELMTQPPKDNERSVRDETLRKLLELVQENTHSEPKPSQEHSSKLVEELKKDKRKGLDYSKEVLDSKQSPTFDEDGFEIPLGKIPLDGHFSTEEVKELVELSKEEGVLKEDVNVKILEANNVVGDRIEVVEELKSNEAKEEDKDDHKKRNKNRK